MPIVFAGVVPHSPVLIPSVGKEHLKKLKKTVAALRRLEQELYGTHPDLEDRNVPFMLRSEAALDYGVVVPLTYLAAHLPKYSVLPIYPSMLPAKSHFEFGQAIQDVLMHSHRRVAVVASADLSHRLTRSAPAGYSPYGRKFDEKILALLKERKHGALITFEPELAAKAAQCGLPPLTILAGILDGIEATPEILSYESPFGIGHVTAHYSFA